MVGPNYRRPCVCPPPSWEEENQEVSERAPSEFAWWEALNDQALNQLIYIGYNQNIPLTIAGLRVMQARAQLGIAIGNFFPQQQQFIGDYSTNRTAFPDPDIYFNDLSLGFDVAWEIDIWGKFRRGIQSAGASLCAQIASYDDTSLSLVAEIARTYIIMRTLEKRIFYAKKNADIQQNALEITQVLYEEGEQSGLDQEQALALLRDTQALIPNFEISLQQAKYALCVLLDLPYDSLQEIIGHPAEIPQVPLDVAVGVPLDMLRRRPDIRLAEFDAMAQCANVGVAQSALYPSFSLIGSIGFTATNDGAFSLATPLKASNLVYTVGPSIVWNLFNYGRLVNKVRVEDAIYEQLLMNYRNVVLTAVNEVESALVALIKFQREAELLEQSVDAQQRSLEISLVQYTEGFASYQRVLDSTQSLTNEQDQFVQAQGDIMTSLVALYKALGGGWEIRCGGGFIPSEVKNEMQERTNWGSLICE